MKLIHRFAYFGGGFIVGILILVFILSGKKTSCDYGPQARTLKNIRLKKHAFSENTMHFLDRNNLDTTSITKLFTAGDVIFSESNTELDSCKQYVIEGNIEMKPIRIKVANCEEVATVYEANFE